MCREVELFWFCDVSLVKANQIGKLQASGRSWEQFVSSFGGPEAPEVLKILADVPVPGVSSRACSHWFVCYINSNTLYMLGTRNLHTCIMTIKISCGVVVPHPLFIYRSKFPVRSNFLHHISPPRNLYTVLFLPVHRFIPAILSCYFGWNNAWVNSSCAHPPQAIVRNFPTLSISPGHLTILPFFTFIGKYTVSYRYWMHLLGRT